jgi:hypothetical protein
MIWPIAGRGRPRKRYIPDILSMAAEDMLANAKWRAISWRTGTPSAAVSATAFRLNRSRLTRRFSSQPHDHRSAACVGGSYARI